MDYVKIEGYNNLLKDPKTNSIVNTNMTEYQNYVTRKNIKNEENERIQNLEKDVASIKDNLDEIKFLLRSLKNESR